MNAKGMWAKGIKQNEVSKLSASSRKASSFVSFIEITDSASKAVQIKQSEVGDLVANRFCSLIEEEMDIPSLRN